MDSRGRSGREKRKRIGMVVARVMTLQATVEFADSTFASRKMPVVNTAVSPFAFPETQN